MIWRMDAIRPTKREALRYLAGLRKIGRSDLWIAEKIGLRSADTFRKWRDLPSVRPSRRPFERLRALARAEGCA